MTKHAIRIHIRGLVQGVGFRPYVYRVAAQHQIRGWVENNNEGVRIHAEGTEDQLEAFLESLRKEAPLAAHIQSLDVTNTASENSNGFVITRSSNLSDEVTEVSPDIAVCEACLEDMHLQPHRHAYPFINCTNCGPRFTIIKALPYDRHLTSMEPFAMCDTCHHEYTNILDRRFHAQPVACKHCGPSYYVLPKGKPVFDGMKLAADMAGMIEQGKTIALKGMGGYHLICDATNEEAVSALRLRKERDGKPMAVMVPSIEIAKKFFSISEMEKMLLQSWRRPIVVVRTVKEACPSVSNGLPTTGVLLPYMPIHYQLFEQLGQKPLVFTSGNISDEPVIISDDEAFSRLSKVSDMLIGYNREIVNRTDDSVAFIVNGQVNLIRRSRGYVPSPVKLGLDVEGIFAAGAELNNVFAMGKGEQAILSQHIGDLKNAETLEFFEESYQLFCELYRFRPQLIVCDSHPDYLSSQFARSLGIETIEVQHHHAHIASCMAEHGLNEKVIGIAFDGTGYGTDGTIWGSEFMVCDLLGFERRYHFDPVPLPGGDHVTKQPWRTALSYLYKYFGEALPGYNIPFLNQIPPEQYQIITQMIDKGLNCPVSSGTGRLFDAVAALTGICYESSYHAEAPMLLEANIKPGCRGKYLFDLRDSTIIFHKMFHQIIRDIQAGTTVDEIAAKFHNTIIAAILVVVRKINKDTGLTKVVLSGGSFQNRYMLELTANLLCDIGFEVFTQSAVPSNDGGIALGQLAIAAKRRSAGPLQAFNNQ